MDNDDDFVEYVMSIDPKKKMNLEYILDRDGIAEDSHIITRFRYMVKNRRYRGF